MEELSEQTLFAERYQLQRLLGRGGFSEVWLAIDQITNMEIAVKVYAPGQGMDKNGMKDFCKELSQVYNLNHTNLVKPQHVDNWKGMPYLVMTYCPKGSCHRLIGTMNEEQIWKFLHDVAAGLAYLHDQGIIHQDIKPDNILVDPLGNYVITDFGISVQSRSTLRKSMNIASDSGTTAYMAPERFSKDPTPVKASDIWSLGATAYELLTGNAPFGEVGGGLQRGGADIPSIHQSISPALRETLALLLSEDPWDRPTAALIADWAGNPSTVELALKNLKKQGTVVCDSFLKISPQSFDVNPIGGEQLIHINTPEPWRFFADANNKWCRVVLQSENVLKISYDANQSGEDRSASINIIAGARAATINMVQKSLPKRSRKALYTSLIVVGILTLVIGVALYNHYYIQEPKRVERLRTIYIEESTRCAEVISSMSFTDGAKKFQMPINTLARIDEMESRSQFSKTKEQPQARALQLAYIDTLKSIKVQLNSAIEKEQDAMRVLNYTEESKMLKRLTHSIQYVDNILNLFNQGCSITEVKERIKTAEK